MFSDSLEAVRKAFIPIFIALVAVFVAVSFYLTIHVMGRKSPDSITINDSRIRLLKNGKTKVEFGVDHIVLSPDQKHYEFKGIHDGVFQRSDKPPIAFRADSGSYDTVNEKLLLIGNIDMKSENGDFFKSERALWDGRQKRLSIPDKVSLGVDGNRISGGSLDVFGDDLTVFSIRKDVKVSIVDLKKTGGKETKKDIEESRIDKSYFKRLNLRAQLVQYDRVQKAMKCFATEENIPVFVPGGAPSMFPTPSPAPVKPGKVTLTGKNFTLKSREMYLDIERRAAQATGQVWALRKGEKKDKNEKNESKVKRAFMAKDTVFETEQANLFWKEGYVDFPFVVSMKKKDMDGYAGRAFVDIKHNTAIFDTGVRFHQKKGDWLIDDEVIDKDESKKVKDAAREETTVTCANMDMDFDNDNLNAFGNVDVVQAHRTLKGGSAHYDGKKKAWSVYQNSFYQDKESSVLADHFTYYEKSKLFEAMNVISAEQKPDDDQRKDLSDFIEDRDGKAPDSETFSRENVRVTAKKVYYDKKKDVLTAQGDAKLFFHDIAVQCDKLHVDYDKDIATVEGNATFDDPRNHITAVSLVIDMKDKRVRAEGDVRYRDAGKKKEGDKDEEESFTLVSKRLEYEWKNGKGTATGNVKISAEERNATSSTALFDRKKKTVRMIGGVKIHQDSGRWLDKRDVFEEKDGKARKLAQKPTDITCAEAFFDDAKDRTDLTGGVHIVQPHIDVKAASVSADSKRKIFEAEGKVTYNQDSGDWLFEEKFIDEDVDEDVEKRIRKPLSVNAEKLVSEYGEDKIYVDGGVSFVEGRNTAKADRLWHYGESKRTVFEGNVSFVDDRGRDFNAERVIYDRANKTVEAFKGIRGSTDLDELNKKK